MTTESDPDQPPGIVGESAALPPVGEAVARLRAFVSEWGDGRIDDGVGDQPPLFSRDIEVVVRVLESLGASAASERNKNRR